jgi:hypothetical protein
VGALGIILAFNYGGKPVFVMPLVFGGAPVVTTMWSRHFGAGFLAGLMVVIAGAVIVLVTAPKGDKPTTAPIVKPPKDSSEHPATV